MVGVGLTLTVIIEFEKFIPEHTGNKLETVQLVVTNGVTEILELLDPVLHVQEGAPLADNVTVVPAQITLLEFTTLNVLDDVAQAVPVITGS